MGKPRCLYGREVKEKAVWSYKDYKNDPSIRSRELVMNVASLNLYIHSRIVKKKKKKKIKEAFYVLRSVS